MAQTYNINLNINGVSQAVAGISQVAQAARLMNAQANLLRASAGQGSGGASSQGFAQRLGTFARSTRFGGGGAMPLLGRGLDVLGAKDPRIAIAVMAIGLTVAMTVGALKVLVKGITEAAAGLTDLQASQTMSGGSASQVAALVATGLGASEVATAAAGLRQRLATDPMAMTAGLRAGISPQIGRAFGAQNEAAILQKGVEYLRSLGEGEKQLREARILGLEAMLPLINVSRQMAGAQRLDAALQSKLLQQNGPAAREFTAALARLGSTWHSLIQSLVGPALPRLTAMIMTFANGLRNLAAFFAANPQIGEDMGRQLEVPFRMILGFLDLISGNAFGPNSMVKGWDASMKATMAGTQATAANTAATQANTAAWQGGTFGGGARAQGAVPASMRGYVLQRAVQGNSFRMGAFTP